MAYGKDPKALDENSNFRQQSAAVQATRPKSSGRSTPRFVNEYQPSLDYPDTIRIIRGSYEVDMADQNGQLFKQRLSWFPFVDHFHGVLKRGAICSAGPLHNWKNQRQPCHGCDIFWGQREAGQKKGPMGKREMYALTVMHFAPYAKVEQVDRAGQIRRNNNGEPYMDWVEVLPHERMKYQGREMREWNCMHWSVGWGHWSVLFDYAKDIGKSCRVCGGRDSITSMAWLCQNCGDAVIDMESTALAPKQIDDLTINPCRCPHCGHEGYLKEAINCNNCGNGDRADIFDVNLQVQRLRSNDGSTQTTLQIKGWSNPGPIDPRFAEFAKPLDLPKIYTPDSLDAQAERWGLRTQAPTAPQGQQPYRPYAQPQGQPQMPPMQQMQQMPPQQQWQQPQQQIIAPQQPQVVVVGPGQVPPGYMPPGGIQY